MNFADPSGRFAITTFLICVGVGMFAGAGLGALSAAQQGIDIWRGALTGALLGGIIGAAVGFALAGTPGGVIAGIGKSFLKAGAKSVFGKFAADITAEVTFGKEIGSLESYMSAFVFGGFVGILGLKCGAKTVSDILVRPAYSILVDDMLFRGDIWSDKKYWTNVAIRFITYGFPADLKPIGRGMLNGLYYQYKSGTFKSLAYGF